MASHYVETLIIGAGISGLLAGKILSQAGIDVSILEKSRGVGGRMATRRFENGVFDHGAQYFTARDRKFRQWVNAWQEVKAIESWFGHDPKADIFPTRKNHPRFIGVKGMTSVPKELAKGLVIQTNTHVKSISNKDNLWVARTERGDRYNGSRIIISAPIPQSLNLLESGGVSLPKNNLEALHAIDYQPCIAGLVLMKRPSAIPSPGGKQFDQGNIQWMGDNTQKGISPKMTAVTIHASPDFSRENFALPAQELAGSLIAAASPWLGQEVLDWQIHKWHYSKPIKTYSEKFLEIPELSGLYIIGDGFGGAKVEGAALSGIEVAHYLREKLLNQAN
jgi:predicted NAD/FAD-dependent oxidoreductase